MALFDVVLFIPRIMVLWLHLGVLVRVPPINFTRMFEPRHNILPNVHTNVGKYLVTWLEHSRESDRRYTDHS